MPYLYVKIIDKTLYFCYLLMLLKQTLNRQKNMTNLVPNNNENSALFDVFGGAIEINETAQKLTEQIGVGYVKDPDEQVIRQFGNGAKVKGAHAAGQFSWCLPGKDTRNELWREVLAVRGFIVKSKNGLVLWGDKNDTSEADKGDEKKKNGPICQSTSCTFGDLELFGAKAYPFPDFYSPEEYQVKNTPIIDMETKFNFVGSRGLSCAECVRRGNHTSGKSYCAINPSIVFAVTHYGDEDFEGNFVWNEITKFPSKSAEGTPLYKEPVLVHIPISKTAYFKATEVENSSTIPSSVVPPDAVPFRKFWLSLAKQNKILAINNPTTPTYWLSEVEMYLATPKDPNAPTKFVPVFKETPVDLKQDRDKLTLFKSCIDTYSSLVESYCSENNYTLGKPRTEESPVLRNQGVKTITAETEANSQSNGAVENGKNFQVWSR
jgi:hypothetical protein